MSEDRANNPAEMTAREVLMAFLTEMCAWERAACKADQTARRGHQNIDPEIWAAQRDAITGKYCTPKKRVYSGPLSFGEPPQYDPETEDITEIVEESPRRMVFLTQQRAGFKNKRRFVVLNRGSQWFVDNWQWLKGDKWSRGVI